MASLSCMWWVLVIPGLFLLWTVISPRSVWQTMASWSYRNPEANEPSDAGYAMQRVGAVIGLIVIIVVLAVLPGMADDVEESRQRDRYEECLDDERAKDDGGLLSPEDWCENLSPSPDAP